MEERVLKLNYEMKMIDSKFEQLEEQMLTKEVNLLSLGSCEGHQRINSWREIQDQMMLLFCF